MTIPEEEEDIALELSDINETLRVLGFLLECIAAGVAECSEDFGVGFERKMEEAKD